MEDGYLEGLRVPLFTCAQLNRAKQASKIKILPPSSAIVPVQGLSKMYYLGIKRSRPSLLRLLRCVHHCIGCAHKITIRNKHQATTTTHNSASSTNITINTTYYHHQIINSQNKNKNKHESFAEICYSYCLPCYL